MHLPRPKRTLLAVALLVIGTALTLADLAEDVLPPEAARVAALVLGVLVLVAKVVVIWNRVRSRPAEAGTPSESTPLSELVAALQAAYNHALDRIGTPGVSTEFRVTVVDWVRTYIEMTRQGASVRVMYITPESIRPPKRLRWPHNPKPRVRFELRYPAGVPLEDMVLPDDGPFVDTAYRVLQTGTVQLGLGRYGTEVLPTAVPPTGTLSWLRVSVSDERRSLGVLVVDVWSDEVLNCEDVHIAMAAKLLGVILGGDRS